MFFCDDVSLIEFKSLYASRLYLSGIVITSGSKSELIALLCYSLVCRMCGLCLVCFFTSRCHFRLCSVIVALPAYLLYYSSNSSTSVRIFHGPVVQSLTSSLVVKMLTVLVSTISNSRVFLLKKKCE